MHSDLRFQDAAAEEAYCSLRLAMMRPNGRAVEWMRLALCACFTARLALLHVHESLAAALLTCSAVIIQFLLVGVENLGCADRGGC